MSLIGRVVFCFVAGVDVLTLLSSLHNANEVAEKDATQAKPRAFATKKGLLARWVLQPSRDSAAFLVYTFTNAEDEYVSSDRWRDPVMHLMVDDAIDWRRNSPLFMGGTGRWLNWRGGRVLA
jgi:hypothetical protein